MEQAMLNVEVKYINEIIYWREWCVMKVQLETNENTMGVKDTGKNPNTQKYKIYVIQSYDLNYHITGRQWPMLDWN